MGFGDVFNSVTEKIRQNTPDLASHVKNTFRSSYGLGCAAVTKIDNVVRGDRSEKLMKEYLPGPESREKIGLHMLNLIDSPVGIEALKLIPGGVQAHQMLKWYRGPPHFQSRQDIKELNDKIKALEAKIDKMLEDPKPEKNNNSIVLKSASSNALHLDAMAVVETPEEVLSIYMKNGIMGKGFLDSRLVPNVGPMKKYYEEGVISGN